MPQLPRSESASSGDGFSWKPVIRPSRSFRTTPYSRVSGTFLTASVAIPPALERAQVGVGAPAGLWTVRELPALGRIVVSRPSSQRTR